MFDYIKKKLGKNKTVAAVYHRVKHHSISERQFREEFNQFSVLSGSKPQRFSIRWSDRYPCLDERTPFTDFDHHYIYHLAWAARILSQTKPVFHVDISSSLQFCTMLSAFMPVRFFDYRPAQITLPDLTLDHADLTSLPFENKSIKSLSCMHTVEHIGLGRYGDQLDPEGDLKAISELKRVLAPEGNLLFVVPVGKPRIMFNAHRIYSYDQIISYFSDLKLINFTLIPDNAIKNAVINNATSQDVDRQEYGCGCFWFTRKESSAVNVTEIS
jgi:SAM-dependent methyltransferase